MDGLTIGTVPKDRAVLPGEQFLVETTFENHGARAAQVPNRQGPSPFVYELLAEKNRAVLLSISMIMRDERRMRDLLPPKMFPMEMLGPGESLSRDEDLAEYLNAGIAPGKYLLRAKYPHDQPVAETALAPITVLTPKYESFSSAVCPRLQILTSVFAHRREDGGVLILQRDSLADPREGVFYRRLKLDAGPPVSVATAVNVVNAGSGRWFGWLRGGALQAAHGWGNRIITQPGPLVVGDGGARLISPGFQVDVGVGLFGVVVPQGGRLMLRTVRATAQGLKVAWQGDIGPDSAQDVRWNHRPEQGTTVVWRDPATSLLHHAAFHPDGKPLQADAVLTRVPVIAWDLETTGDPVVRMVARDAAGNYRLATFRQGPGKPADPLQSLPPLENVSQWGICGVGDESAKVVAVSAAKLWAASAGQTTWVPIADVKDTSNLHAFSPRGRTCWAEWVERGSGIVRMAIP